MRCDQMHNMYSCTGHFESICQTENWGKEIRQQDNYKGLLVVSDNKNNRNTNNSWARTNDEAARKLTNAI